MPLVLALAAAALALLAAAAIGIRAATAPHGRLPTPTTVTAPSTPTPTITTPRPPALTARAADRACVGLLRLMLTLPWTEPAVTAGEVARFATTGLARKLTAGAALDDPPGLVARHLSITAAIGRPAFSPPPLPTRAIANVTVTARQTWPAFGGLPATTTTQDDTCAVVATPVGARVVGLGERT